MAEILKLLTKLIQFQLIVSAFPPDNKTIVSASDDGTIKLWEFNTGKEIKTLKKILNQLAMSDSLQMVRLLLTFQVIQK